MTPTFEFENAANGLVCGVDEVGRGPLAGPVLAAAVILPSPVLEEFLALGLTDSKKLTQARREKISAWLQKSPQIHIGFGQADVQEIDSLNILQASLLAMRRAIEALPVKPDHALIDGNRVPKALPCSAEALVKGDSRSFSIAAASVVAKVKRDRLMAELALTHPFYGWENNAGYGTKQHLEALEKHGVTDAHRRSFAPVARAL